MADTGVITYVDGVAMLVLPDGREYRWSDVQRATNPNLSFDDRSGEMLPLPSADTDTSVDNEPNYFGDVAERYGNKEISAARDILANAGGVAAQSLPEELGILRNMISYPADLANAALLGLIGGGQKAVAYGAELMPGSTQSEKRLARDILGGAEISGAAPQGRMAGLLSAPAAQAVKSTRYKRGF